MAAIWDQLVARDLIYPTAPERIGCYTQSAPTDAQVAAVLELLIERRHEPASEKLARAIVEAVLGAK